MRFLIDEHLPAKLVDLLAELGGDARHVKTEGLLSASDNELWSLAADLGAVMVSKDSDFLTLARRDQREASLLLLSVGNISNRELYDVIRKAWPQIVEGFGLGNSVVEVRA